MPLANLVLVLLIGFILGVVASVVLKSRRFVFLINILLGMLGACMGAFAPVMIGTALSVNVVTPNYLLRALLAAFVLVLIACLFRPAKPHGVV